MMRLALYLEHPVTGAAVSMTRIKLLLVDSAFTNWSIYHLCTYMGNKYRQMGHNDTDYFPPFNWLNAPLQRYLTHSRHLTQSRYGRLLRRLASINFHNYLTFKTYNFYYSLYIDCLTHSNRLIVKIYFFFKLIS